MVFIGMSDQSTNESVGRYMKNERDGKVEMPVALALMIAQNEAAINSFNSLSTDRRDEYLRRARCAQSKAEMRSVVNDIIKIG